MNTRFVYPALALIALSGCASADGIAVAPTRGDALPPAIVGNAPPLGGAPVAYYDGDARASGYLAVPSGPGPFPAVILIHEWNGLVQRVKETADAFAAEGYVALAADLYSGRTGSNRAENMALVQETLANPQQIIDNLNAAVGFLRARSDTTGKVASIGWCYGGGVALSFALGGDNHEGTAIFYGRLLNDPERMQHLHHPVYGTFVREDQGIPVESVHAFVETMRRMGISNDVHIYDDVRHGFWLHVDRDPAVNTGPAQDAWVRLKAYLQKVLGS